MQILCPFLLRDADNAKDCTAIVSPPSVCTSVSDVDARWSYRLGYTNISTALLPESKVIGLHLRRRYYWSIFIQIFLVGSERRMCFETECIMVLQGHPRSLILVPIENAYATSYWSSIVTLVLYCPVSEILITIITIAIPRFALRASRGKN